MSPFIGIEFNDGTVALVHKCWLTPRKKHSFWPPYRQQKQYWQALRMGEEPTDNWKLHEVTRSFFETG